MLLPPVAPTRLHFFIKPQASSSRSADMSTAQFWDPSSNDMSSTPNGKLGIAKSHLCSIPVQPSQNKRMVSGTFFHNPPKIDVNLWIQPFFTLIVFSKTLPASFSSSFSLVSSGSFPCGGIHLRFSISRAGWKHHKIEQCRNQRMKQSRSKQGTRKK